MKPFLNSTQRKKEYLRLIERIGKLDDGRLRLYICVELKDTYNNLIKGMNTKNIGPLIHEEESNYLLQEFPELSYVQNPLEPFAWFGEECTVGYLTIKENNQRRIMLLQLMIEIIGN